MGIDPTTQADAYKAQVFWMDFKTTAFDHATPSEFWATLAQQHRSFDAQRLPALVQGMCLAEHMHKSLFMLSTGSKRKVWLAGAFACGAALTLVDDPFAALDKASIRFVTDQLKVAALEGTRAWVIAHYAHLGDVPVATTLELGD
jgi:ABC-type multidrug transport system ATPase subunit